MDISLKNKSDISGTHWIEFNVSGTMTEYKHWADNSKYLDEYAYNFYTDIFEKVTSNFNYYGDTKFNKEQLMKLKQEIERRVKTFDNLQSLPDIIEFSKRTSYALNLTQDIQETYYMQNGQQNKLIGDLKRLGNDLSHLVDICINQDKTLWVLGM
jgi:hypothetical protein